MAKKTMYIVWNKPRNEAVVFASLEDAKHAANVKRQRNFYSSLADAFNEMYADDGKLKVEKIEVEE